MHQKSFIRLGRTRRTTNRVLPDDRANLRRKLVTNAHKGVDSVHRAVDPNTRSQSEGPESGADAWGALLPIDAGLTQAEADRQLATYLAGVPAGEPLCIRAHGNDVEIGDAEAGAKDWGWTYKKLARMLATHLTATPSIDS